MVLWGAFNITLISDFRNKRDITLLKFFENKYISYSGNDEHSSIFQHMPALIIEKTDSTQQLCGYTCKHAYIYSKESKNERHEIFYTNSIGNKNPNFNNPYKTLDGVMLQFHLQLGNISMELIADNISNEETPDKEFAINGTYQPTTTENMNKLIDKILEN
ncbi:MAG: hypothetical protein HC896_18825 [Bacteroidales bacterium]|nr:hypothetical protein [Bacteroidales bacterium]